jgi:hypothetical protein
MWIMLKNSFLSVVHKDCEKDELLVRARRKGDIEKVFPCATVNRTPGVDYLYRAAIKREVVAQAMTDMLMSYTADNFKNSVKDNQLHTAYMGIWNIMARLQHPAPYTRGAKELF